MYPQMLSQVMFIEKSFAASVAIKIYYSFVNAFNMTLQPTLCWILFITFWIFFTLKLRFSCYARIARFQLRRVHQIFGRVFFKALKARGGGGSPLIFEPLPKRDSIEKLSLLGLYFGAWSLCCCSSTLMGTSLMLSVFLKGDVTSMDWRLIGSDKPTVCFAWTGERDLPHKVGGDVSELLIWYIPVFLSHLWL